MPRDLPLGNGRLLVAFDSDYRIRDLYFPHVGQENHAMGNAFRLGVWVDGRFSWVGPEWKRELLYLEDTLVSDVRLYHEGLGLLMVCHDAVDFHEDLFLREITLENLHAEPREVRIFMSHGFEISGNSVGDTAAFDPKSSGLVHYKGARYFLANGMVLGKERMDQFAVGQRNVDGLEGTFSDAEDGVLSGNPVAQGTVDSVLALHFQMEGMSKATGYYWLAAGQNWQEVRRLDDLVRHKGAAPLIKRTTDYWRLWVRKETPPLHLLPDKLGALYRRSLLILNTQIDWQGGILAANDSDVVLFNRDTYSYVWPRDGALVANALDVAGYPGISQRFYHFAAGIIEKEGYFLHKYNPDGTLASSWHPWMIDGQEQLPVQEDETALVIWALWNHFVLFRDIEFIKPLYRSLIKNGGDFMCRYRDPETGLPDFSYDLWEERRGYLSFTTGAVFGGLTAASLFCTVFGEDDRAAKYREAASEIRDAASLHLWRPELNRFCRMLSRDSNDQLIVDAACDASLWGLFAFGMYTADDERIQATVKALRQRLWLTTPVGGMARYELDDYHRVRPGYPGNPWFICTLWLADHLISSATDESNLNEAMELMTWVADHALPSGVLAEQVHPDTGAPLSVSPLTWSHATYIATAQRLLRLMGRLKKCPECGVTADLHSRDQDWLATLYGEACNAIRGICQVK